MSCLAQTKSWSVGEVCMENFPSFTLDIVSNTSKKKSSLSLDCPIYTLRTCRSLTWRQAASSPQNFYPALDKTSAMQLCCAYPEFRTERSESERWWIGETTMDPTYCMLEQCWWPARLHAPFLFLSDTYVWFGWRGLAIRLLMWREDAWCSYRLQPWYLHDKSSPVSVCVFSNPKIRT
jgi:hypothetical protein